jgi:EmrB/QacA subfamily drug resistance transporter
MAVTGVTDRRAESVNNGPNQRRGVAQRGSRNLVLAAMIFAVAMSFIDQTIVSIAAPQIQSHLGLSSAGIQWAINAYLLSLAALFALGGRVADMFGHARVCVIGVVIFAASSTLCGLTPTGGIAETWLIVFRAVQGAGGALMFPAALAVVVQTFEVSQRGRALAIFFGIAGGLTAIGPILGGVLTEWTWRAIFWINIPVAIVALVLIAISRPQTEHQRSTMDFRGLALICSGVALSVLGLQQATTWGWSNPATTGSIVVGSLILVAFFFVEQRTASPLMNVGIFKLASFSFDNAVLFISMIVFIPLFFFASEYAQISLELSAQNAGVVLLYFFLGFMVGSQVGGRMLDRVGVRRPAISGCFLCAAGLWLWAHKMTDLHLSAQVWWIVLAGLGMGLMLSPTSTDAVSRAGRLSYGEATGITQTIRNYAASLGFAVLGTVLIDQFRSQLTSGFVALGVPLAKAVSAAESIADTHRSTISITDPHLVPLAFAHATATVFTVMAIVMAVAGVVGVFGLPRGLLSHVTPDVPDVTAVEPSAT